MIHSVTQFPIAELVGVYAYLNGEVVDDRKRDTDPKPAVAEQLNSSQQESYLPELSTFLDSRNVTLISKININFLLNIFNFILCWHLMIG